MGVYALIRQHSGKGLEMQNVFMSRSTAMVAMVLGLAVSVSAQGTPFTKIASASQFSPVKTGE